VIRTDSNGTLNDYIEKPTIPYSVSMGINVLSKKCLDFVPPTGKFDMPDLMLAMHHAGHPVHCYESDCYWKDIGRFDDYQQASEDFMQNPSWFRRMGGPHVKALITGIGGFCGWHLCPAAPPGTRR